MKKLLFIAMMFMLAGCSGTGDKDAAAVGSPQTESTAEETGAEVPPEPSEEESVGKYNAYVTLANTINSDIDEVLSSYTAEFGYEAEFVMPEDFYGYTMPARDIDFALRDAMEYVDTEPESPVDEPLKQIEPELLAYIQTLAEIESYYMFSDYQDDNNAKSQQYHDAILGGYDSLMTNLSPFFNAVEEMTEGMTENEIEEFKAEGRMIHYHALVMLSQGQDFMQFLSGNLENAEALTDAQIQEFAAVHDGFTASYDGYFALVGEDDTAGEDEGIEHLIMFNSAVKNMKVFMDEAAGIIQESRSVSGINFDGAAGNYSALLETYNRYIV